MFCNRLTQPIQARHQPYATKSNWDLAPGAGIQDDHCPMASEVRKDAVEIIRMKFLNFCLIDIILTRLTPNLTIPKAK
jgi:hypothetical protein